MQHAPALRFTSVPISLGHKRHPQDPCRSLLPNKLSCFAWQANGCGSPPPRPLSQSLDPISVFAGVSNWAQWAVAQVLDDADWAAGFLRDNVQLLAASYDVLEGEGAACCGCWATLGGGLRVGACGTVGLQGVVPVEAGVGAHRLVVALLAADGVLILPNALAAHEPAAAALKEEKIPFVPAVAGMFVWIDLR